MSNRSGEWQIWTIKPDGSGLEQLTDAPGFGAATPVWSPDGARMLGQPLRGARSFVIRTDRPWKDQTRETLTGTESGTALAASSWSAGRALILVVGAPRLAAVPRKAAPWRTIAGSA